ncbi:HTH-type transcriptional regulator / antitoxin HipB [Roseateles sp. YR242]|uniref:helix-turn-helix domain-containing protein n=1 Tax=Roseateles sp. YR242 TaxID=1855305 RepID=UPI0008D0F271|nr:helix-turn-helix domain-containing protein [Roseateles sp. YR242]SEL49051.1 HTH-type transcriptional regulator / antitoxin HipB [Roseateles sp. YR242]
MDYPVTLVTQLKQHLRSMRKANGLTQAALAQRLGVGQSRVADIEANPGVISVEQLLQVLTALNAQMVVRDLHASVEPDVAAASQDTNTPKGQW